MSLNVARHSQRFMSALKGDVMEAPAYENEELRVHSEAPAEGDAAFDPGEERMHAEAPAEGPAYPDGSRPALSRSGSLPASGGKRTSSAPARS
jgi:hypothetical protein